MVVIGVLYIDVVGAAGSWRWLSVSCIALCVIWDGIFYKSVIEKKSLTSGLIILLSFPIKGRMYCHL